VGRLIHEKDGHIATVILNSPEAKNALDPQIGLMIRGKGLMGSYLLWQKYLPVTPP
jgi:hypothetical protein